MKIAVGGITTENSTFSCIRTRAEDFHVLRGAAILERNPFLRDVDGVTFVPILHASALPGGSVEQSAYEAFKAQLLDGLRADGPWDGVFMDMHGAMNVYGMDDAEGDWMESVRQVVGPDCLISASYDLHGNVSERVMANIDLFTAFRTAPHLDYMETRERAVALLVDCLQRQVRPFKVFIRVPVVLPGERTSTEWEPGQSLYAHIPDSLAVPGVMDVSIMIGYVWADEPRASATVIGIGTDEDAVRGEVVRLANAFWDVRAHFDFGVPVGTADECIQMGLAAPESCVFISDSGDNPTAGGVGDVTHTLGRLIALDVPSAVYASIPDAAAVDLCHQAGIGAQVSLSVGGKLDTVYSEPLTITGEVLMLKTFPWGDTDMPNRQAVVAVGGVKVILTEQRTPFHYMRQFEQLEIDALAHKLVVVKIGYLVPDLKQAAPKALLALSPGAVNQAITELPFKRLTRPVYPLDPNMNWTASL